MNHPGKGRKPRIQTPTFLTCLSIADMGVVLLVLAVTISALAIATSKFESRKQFALLQVAQSERDALHVQWSQLLLEQGAWGSQARIEKIAGKQLNMEAATAESVVVIEP